MSEYLNDKEAEKVEQLIECNCAGENFTNIDGNLVAVSHSLSCPLNILYRGKKQRGKVIKKK